MFKNAADEGPSTGIPSMRRSSRMDSSEFNVRIHCFIYGKGDKKTERLTLIKTGTGIVQEREGLGSSGQIT